MVNPTNIQPSAQSLKEVKLFKCFTEDELTKLIKMGATASYEAHANIVIEGELSWGLYIILGGMVGIFKTNKLSGDIYDVGQLRAGSFFGEMSIVDDNPRSATVRAVAECHLFYISKDVFMKFLEDNKLKIKFYESCVQDLVHRLRELDDNYVISQYQLWKSALKKEAA
jgi:CRP/FNR family transcriptional regulator/CRP/FNR family cyclic AMP-dependent transcriptional regulator